MTASLMTRNVLDAEDEKVLSAGAGTEKDFARVVARLTPRLEESPPTWLLCEINVEVDESEKTLLPPALIPLVTSFGPTKEHSHETEVDHSGRRPFTLALSPLVARFYVMEGRQVLALCIPRTARVAQDDGSVYVTVDMTETKEEFRTAAGAAAAALDRWGRCPFCDLARRSGEPAG